MRRKTPIRALLEGVVAGVVGAGVQTLFFRATAKLAPAPPKQAFRPPEPQQADEDALQTVARRAVEGLAQRGPLDARDKERAGQIVHYGFGAAWGGLYGLLRASYPRLWSASGIGGFALGVWVLSDNVILPGFKLAAWPHRYPLRSHAYALAAHLAYGGGVAATLAAVDHAKLLPLAAALVVAKGRAAGEQAIELARSRALVPREALAASRHLASLIARRARDLTR